MSNKLYLCNECSLITISGNAVRFLHDPSRLLLAIPALLPRLTITVLLMLGLLILLGTLLMAVAGGFIVQLRHSDVKHGVKGKHHATVFGASKKERKCVG